MTARPHGQNRNRFSTLYGLHACVADVYFNCSVGFCFAVLIFFLDSYHSGETW